MMNSPGPRSSFRILAQNKQASLRLFCFPHAGAGVSPYFSWARLLAADLEVVGIQLPGRENRISESPLSQMDEVVSLLAQELGAFSDLPFVFFGHSMGALIAFELTHHLRRQRGPQPMHLFVSGRAAPNWPVPRVSELPAAELLEYVRSFDGTASEVLNSPEMMSIFLPLLKADFSVCASRSHLAEPPLHCRISAFGGDRDPTATPEMISDWKEQTSNVFRLTVFPGSHFFVSNTPREVARVIQQQLREDGLLKQETVRSV